MANYNLMLNVLLFTEALTREKEKVDTLNENILKEKVRYSQSSSSNFFNRVRPCLTSFPNTEKRVENFD